MTTAPDRRPPDDELRVAAYLQAWPLLTVDEARRELGLIDAASPVEPPPPPRLVRVPCAARAFGFRVVPAGEGRDDGR